MPRRKWLLKTEPGDYSYDDLERDGGTRWDGVTNALALKHLREMRRGDEAIVYHTGDERAAVAVASVATDPYADPDAGDPKLVVVEVRPKRRLGRPVGLAEIKARPDLSGFDLVRLPRLSVVPVTEEQWKALLAMSRE